MDELLPKLYTDEHINYVLAMAQEWNVWAGEIPADDGEREQNFNLVVDLLMDVYRPERMRPGPALRSIMNIHDRLSRQVR